MMDTAAAALVLAGSLFCLLGAIGLLRMPDLFTRLQASTKAGTLGVALIMLGVAIRFADVDTSLRAILVIAFLFLTAPVAAHMIARAAYFVRVPLWERTVLDELRGRYTAARDAPPGEATPQAPPRDSD